MKPITDTEYRHCKIDIIPKIEITVVIMLA